MQFNINLNAHVNHSHGEMLEVRHKLEMIMSAISDYVTQQKAFNDAVSADISGIANSLTAIDGDIAVLNDKITALQASQGQITPEDQLLLDGLQADGLALAARTKAAKDAAAALDDKTPPAAPPVV